MVGRRILAFFALLLVRLFRATWRVRVVGAQRAGSVYAFWHGDQIGLTAAPLEPLPTVLVSRSRDGELASRIVSSLGYSTVRGSSSRGAVRAALTLVRRLRQRETVAVAADGPRGPRHRAGDGLAKLADCASAAVVPIAAVARRALRFGSWDRLQLPLPFTTVVVVIGARVVDRGEGAVQRALARTHRRAARLSRGKRARAGGETLAADRAP